MKHKKDKLSIVIIIVLSIIVVLLAAIIVIVVINKQDGKFEKNIIQKETNIMMDADTKVPEENELKHNSSMISLGIYTVDGQTVDSVYYDGGTCLEITELSENEVSFTYKSISAPPANRIADIIIKDAQIIDGKAEFTFDNDGWYNRGTGYIKFEEDDKIKIHVDITRMNEHAMFNISSGTQTLTFNQEQ